MPKWIKTTVHSFAGEVPLTPTQILGPNPNRIYLRFSAGAAVGIAVSFTDSQGTSQDFNINTNLVPLELKIGEIGTIMQQAVYLFAVGAVTLVISEVSLARDSRRKVTAYKRPRRKRVKG